MTRNILREATTPVFWVYTLPLKIFPLSTIGNINLWLSVLLAIIITFKIEPLIGTFTEMEMAYRGMCLVALLNTCFDMYIESRKRK